MKCHLFAGVLCLRGLRPEAWWNRVGRTRENSSLKRRTGELSGMPLAKSVILCSKSPLRPHLTSLHDLCRKGSWMGVWANQWLKVDL